MAIDHAISHVTLAGDAHDQLMIENCRPPNHVNPTPSGKYNLIAIGAGAAGLVSAGGAGGLGAKTAIIERALMGGDCLVTGCVPSKGIIRAARAVYDLQRAQEFGVRLSSEAQVDFAFAMERMRKLRAQISHNDAAARMTDKYNVDVYLGEARFISPSAVEVAGQRLEFDRAVIATGGRPAELPIPGLKETGYHTNETIFTITELPRRMAVIGGGPIGCELAQAFQRFGSQVTILNDVECILPREDADAAELIQRQLLSEGITIHNQVKITRVEQRQTSKAIFYEYAGEQAEIVCDVILSAAGRVPNVEGLNLEAAGVRYSREGVLVDDRLRTSNPKIYAAGDVCLKYKFTHAADATARAVLRNALFFGRAKVSDLVMPWVTYTDPELAHVGFYEADARAAGFDVATITERFDDNDRAILDGETEGFARVHYDRKTGKLLGGTIVARHAGEMIGELTLAITHGLKAGALSTTIHPYPTQAAVLQRIGDAYNRTRLSPFVSKLFKSWFAWKR
ncbi:MAG TPA: mercuric reductase [Blastocatellia bacterium]|nr:mercuric reductase [Blastocatellia bacterium]HMX28381.1 mercuric reductase [Blastocatellia bacterium]HMY74520.1 mercuric reductase [Blastocatellia bacterium]HMZ18299.1 mercuric reductase [Blastocatellia bacterium]HNG33071.1 mercuric reductase [Blastocatellia bacterium]